MEKTGSLTRGVQFSSPSPVRPCLPTAWTKMTGYDNDGMGLMAKAADFLRLRGRLEASPFHFINLGVLAYIGMGQVRR